MEEKFKELPKESNAREGHTADFGKHIIDVYKIIELSRYLETKEENIAMFKEALGQDHKYWIDKKGSWIGPKDIIDSLEACGGNYNDLVKNHPEWEEHIRKVEKANYQDYPVILIRDIIVDGMHRLTKAFIDKAEKIKIKRFDDLPKEVIMH